jgi:hypothetical protein
MAQGVLATYSGLALNGAINSPLFGAIILAGINQAGINRITIRMDTNHAELKRGMDGAQVPSYVPGESGVIEISVWQTSQLQQQLLQAYNAVLTLSLTGDVSESFGATIYLENTSDQSSHTASGCMLQKVPDKPYQEQAQEVNWMFTCAHIISEPGGAVGAVIGSVSSVLSGLG